MEKINKDYDEFNKDLSIVKSDDVLRVLIDVEKDTMDYEVKKTLKNIRKNKCDEVVSSIVNIFGEFTRSFEFPEMYKDRNDIERDYIVNIKIIKSYYETILNNINKDNYLELAKLYYYVRDYYIKLVNHYDLLIDKIDCKYSGLTMIINDGFNDIMYFDEFFKDKINEINGVKVLEKK